jgi:hypothetical protein
MPLQRRQKVAPLVMLTAPVALVVVAAVPAAIQGDADVAVMTFA